jgi:glutamate 5-kinase
MAEENSQKNHRRDRVKFFKEFGYHPEIPLKPKEETGKAALGIPCDFFIWNKSLSKEPPENYSNYSQLNRIDTLIIKVSSNIIVHKSDPPFTPERGKYNIVCIAEEISNIGLPTIIITGGARGLSKKSFLPPDLGQEKLFELWKEKFENSYFSLVTPEDLQSECSKIDSFSEGQIMIVNEYGSGLFEGANDEVAAKISLALKNSRRNVLTLMAMNHEGIYTSKSYKNGNYDEVIRVVLNPEGLEEMANEISSRFGTGGLAKKISYIKTLVNAGINVVLFNGQYCNHDLKYQRKNPNSKRYYNPIKAALEGKVVGTRFLAKENQTF